MWPPGVPWATSKDWQVSAQRMATVVPLPSVATSRSPSWTPAAARAVDDRRRRLSVPGNGLSRGAAVGQVGEGGLAAADEAGRHEAFALDAGVTAGRQTRHGDEKRAARGVNRPDLSAVFVRGDQVAREAAKRRRRHRHAAFDQWCGRGQGGRQAIAVNAEDRRLVAIVRAGHQQAMAEVADAVQRDTAEGVHTAERGESTRLAAGVNAGDAWRRGQVQDEHIVGVPAAGRRSPRLGSWRRQSTIRRSDQR